MSCGGFCRDVSYFYAYDRAPSPHTPTNPQGGISEESMVKRRPLQPSAERIALAREQRKHSNEFSSPICAGCPKPPISPPSTREKRD